jgi:hypothetical protein
MLAAIRVDRTTGGTMTSAQHRSVPAPLAHTDVLVLDYLAALWAAAEDLDAEVRDDLMVAVADYIALRRVSAEDDAEYVLRLLGPPESLAAAARRGRMPAHVRVPAPPPAAPAPPAVPAGGAEYAAIALLTLGALLLPVVGPIAGLLLMAGSPRWTAMQKVTASTLAVGTAAFGAAVGFVLVMAGGDAAGVFLAWCAAVAGPIGAALMLVPSMTDRGNRAPRPPAPRYPAPGWR